ncbi:unnamed protein product, partial [Brenthis ino]
MKFENSTEDIMHEKAPGERLREDRRRAAWQAFPPFCQTDVFIGNTDALPEDTLAIPDTMHRTLIPDYCDINNILKISNLHQYFDSYAGGIRRNMNKLYKYLSARIMPPLQPASRGKTNTTQIQDSGPT